MKIMKEAEVKALGTAGADDMAAINRLARRELTAEEVYTFAVRLCDNDIDRDLERFDEETLEELGTLFVGVSGMFDHQWSAKGQAARIYRTEVTPEEGVLTADGRPYRCLKGWAYMMRTGENAGLIAEIDGGIKQEVSVGCAVRKTVCSICGEELGSCSHVRGEEYDGQLCHGILTGASDVYEWSFVAVPAQRRAGVVKGVRRLEDEARLGRSYLKSLRREMVRLGGMAQPEAEHELLVKVADRLDEEELVGLIKLFRRQTEGRYVSAAQLVYENGGDGPGEADPAFLI